ncbi:sigma-70 family RNA polymerase sigma factor, partial [Micromonospora globispora]
MEPDRGDQPDRAADRGVTTAAAQAAGAVQAHRPMLLGLAYRLLGSLHDAEDVLQEAYLRWLDVDRESVAEPRRYLSRVVTRLALDRLRARQAARETYVGPWLPEPVPTAPSPFGPLDSAELRDSLSTALLHLLERLTPPERAVYVLHTAFGLPYAEIGDILDRSAADCRQLHHRAAARIVDH